uniref:Succinate dehydrogenase assembly factor 2, mitochondrial n=1 Tax=Ficus carica TaxID=3494 RepID=A0AA88JEQ5_FICCA|nr:hypothetical protein TIFTF001_055155 [Ficus carica]GMN71459.1 hypothetical protein TIFTF001_055157 [Ficus carica]
MGSLRRALITVDRLLKSTAATQGSLVAAASSLLRTEALTRPVSNCGISRFYSENHSNAQSLDVDLSNDESKRRLYNRLIYRSKQRGFLELDLVLGKWVEEHIPSMDENGIKALAYVLDLIS